LWYGGSTTSIHVSIGPSIGRVHQCIRGCASTTLRCFSQHATVACSGGTTYLGHQVFVSKMGHRLATAARHLQSSYSCILRRPRAVIVREIRLPRADLTVKTHRPNYLNNAVSRPCPAFLGGIIRIVLHSELPR
jgi:hypothetical protein